MIPTADRVTPPRQSRDRDVRRFTGLDIGVFVGIVVLGLARVPAPFTGDQALNMLIGKVIAHGGAPYVDLWDLKHPGIFFFFAAGGSLFGFTEIGIHLFELLWMLALALAVRWIAAECLETRAAVSLAPGFTVGFYYATASGLLLTQAEVIVGLPLVLCLATVAAAVRPGRRHRFRWFFASGLCGGVVVLFKAPYVLIPAIFWILALIDARRERGRSELTSWRALWSLLAGAALPVAGTVIYLASRHALGAAWWTFTVYTREAVGQTSIEVRHLLESASWFVRTFLALLILAGVGSWNVLRAHRGLVTKALIAWIPAGLLLIWGQVTEWYTYHYLLILVPLGVLATRGTEILWTRGVRSQRRSQQAVALTVLVVSLAVSIPAVKTGPATVADVIEARPLPFDGASARSYQTEHDQAYAQAAVSTRFLFEPGAAPGAIYVFGSPIYYVLTDRSPAIPYFANWFHATQETWATMQGDLDRAMPPYVLVTPGALRSFVEADPELASDVADLRSWLDRHYQPLRTRPDGTWYARRDSA